MNFTQTLVSRTELDKEKIKLLGIFVRRMFDAKGNSKSSWKKMTWLGLGNSVIATLNDVMEKSVETLLEDLTSKEKENLLKNGQTFVYPFPDPKTIEQAEANGDAWDEHKKKLGLEP